MKKPNLTSLSVKESVSITEFKTNLGDCHEKLRNGPLLMTNRFFPNLVIINAQDYTDLLAHAKKMEEQLKAKK